MPDSPLDAAGSLAAEVSGRLRDQYDQALFGGDDAALTAGLTELDTLQGILDLARGRLLHTQFLATREEPPGELAAFERAAAAFAGAGDEALEAEARFWIGCYHQVVHRDGAAALPPLVRAGELAAAAGDERTLSYVERHLGFHDWEAGRTEQAREHLENSLSLRRKIGFEPGVAAALLALAEFCKEQGEIAVSDSYLTEARHIAEATGSRGVLRWIDQDMG
jgi:tetratricopeptide (TPR) repeat protein